MLNRVILLTNMVRYIFRSMYSKTVYSKDIEMDVKYENELHPTGEGSTFVRISDLLTGCVRSTFHKHGLL